MNKLRVLHIFHEIKFSGAEIMYSNAAELFQTYNVELYAFSTGEKIGDFSSEFIKNGIKVLHRPIPSKRNVIALVSYLKDIIAFVEKEKINLIHIHRSDVKWLFSLIAKITKVKCVYTAHNVFKHRKFTWIKGYIDRYTAVKWFGLKIHSIGPSVYENELNYYKTYSIKINNWFDEKKFFPLMSLEEKKNIRSKLNISVDDFVIISTGGCSDVKNHKDIILALSLLRTKKKITYLHLGSGHKEHEEMKLAIDLGVNNQIYFLGNKANVREYLVASDLYIMPSLFEGLSIASIEAMACGIPSILYDVPGLRDIVQNNDNGLLIKPDVNLLVESIYWVITNPLAAKEKATNALYYVNKEFSMKKSVNEIVKLYY